MTYLFGFPLLQAHHPGAMHAAAHPGQPQIIQHGQQQALSLDPREYVWGMPAGQAGSEPARSQPQGAEGQGQVMAMHHPAMGHHPGHYALAVSGHMQQAMQPGVMISYAAHPRPGGGHIMALPAPVTQHMQPMHSGGERPHVACPLRFCISHVFLSEMYGRRFHLLGPACVTFIPILIRPSVFANLHIAAMVLAQHVSQPMATSQPMTVGQTGHAQQHQPQQQEQHQPQQQHQASTSGQAHSGQGPSSSQGPSNTVGTDRSNANTGQQQGTFLFFPLHPGLYGLLLYCSSTMPASLRCETVNVLVFTHFL